ncbi:MAG TPA: glycosyltransferase family 2 protein, partial [Roseiflexaceae bacterium]|nr:glycosyltransferase family 2 protein [Roseiflexaceae bacterium]
FYNAQRFLGDTIESVCAQTFQDWELLLVDDGSCDQSTAIAREYEQRYPNKVRYIEHPGHQNRGASPSRNVGIRAARGEYIALLDADDIWLPHKLEQQVAIMRAHPEVGMVYGKPLYWHSWSPEATHRDVESGLGVPPETIVSPPHLVWRSYPLGRGASPVLSDLLFRASILKRIGLFEESFIGKYQMYEDQIFLSKIYVSETVYVSGQFWTKYRQHVESCMGQGRWSGEYDGIRKRFLTWFGGYLAQRRVRDPRIWGALQRAWLPYRYPRLTQAFSRGRQLAGRARNLAVARITRRAGPPVGRVRWGDLGGLEPISRSSGFRRGQPIDRLYIERFLEQHSSDIHGATLEAGDDTYTRRFGGARTQTRDVLDVSPGNPQATIVADLADAGMIESQRFDCIVLTQTLQ